jgi:hypothetical protein
MILNPGYISETGTHLKNICNFFHTCEHPAQKLFGCVCRIYSESSKINPDTTICPFLIKLLYGVNPDTFHVIFNFSFPDRSVIHFFASSARGFISYQSLSTSFHYTKMSANKIKYEAFNYSRK